MNSLASSQIQCPYCGESVELLIDCSVPEQQYIEDCFVCCRPIEIQVLVDVDGLPQVIARDENEA